MKKSEIDLSKTAEEAFNIAMKRARAEQIKTPLNSLNSLKHCASEVAEAVDAFNMWYCAGFFAQANEDEMTRRKQKFALEIADILMCVLTISHAEKIDITAALLECLEKNKARVNL